MRSSAKGVALGGSSWIDSQPTGGDPGGDIRKFLLEIGGWRYASEGIVETSGSYEKSGFGSARYTRSLSSSDLNNSWLRKFVTKELNRFDVPLLSSRKNDRI